MDKKIFVFLGLLGISIFLLIVDISFSNSALAPPYKILLLLLVVFFDVLAFSSRFYTYIMMPLITQRKRHVVLNNEDAYWLSGSSDAILHKENDEFTATVYVKIPLYRSGTEMTREEKLEFTKQVSRLVGTSKEPARFTSLLYVMNKDLYIQNLRDTISSAEHRESELIAGNAPQNELERVRGQLNMWHNMLDNVGAATSLELMIYASVSAKGVKEYEAISAAQQRARELISGTASIFGVAPSIVTGDAILKFVEPEFLIPYSTISEQIARNVREQVI
jgi:hypothetical protein